jgi:hypothetical protein
VPDLVLLFLLASCVSLASQVLSLIRLARQRGGGTAENLVSRGYARTIACRVMAAVTYVVVAAVQLAGSGTLSAEALVVFASVQFLWISNSLADIRIRRRLGGGEDDPRGRHAR